LRDKLIRAQAKQSIEKQGMLRYLEQTAGERSKRETELDRENQSFRYERGRA
jgi:hypothetical protein